MHMLAMNLSVYIVTFGNSEAIYDRYGGDKNLIIVDGDHNTARPRFLYDSVGIFLTQTLQVRALSFSVYSRVQLHVREQEETMYCPTRRCVQYVLARIHFTALLRRLPKPKPLSYV